MRSITYHVRKTARNAFGASPAFKARRAKNGNAVLCWENGPTVDAVRAVLEANAVNEFSGQKLTLCRNVSFTNVQPY